MPWHRIARRGCEFRHIKATLKSVAQEVARGPPGTVGVPVIAVEPDHQFMQTKRNVIAVIDDNLSVLGAMGRLLGTLGYDTELYATAAEFLDPAVTTEAMCLIIDIHLGESSGIDLARHLTKARFTIPIIFMSADVHESAARQAMEIGCVAFLRKPFTAEILIEALAKVPPGRTF
jgi:CheY-like chemotaxis protein